MVTLHPRDPLDCANGASQYLFYGGIIIIATNVLGLLAGCARQAALKVGGWFTARSFFCSLQDGRISCGENCGLCVLGLLSGILGIAAVVTLIWVGWAGFNGKPLYFYSMYGMVPFTVVVTDFP